MKTKNKLIVQSIAIKEEAKNVITPMNFAEHLRKSDVSENSKVYYGRFLQNGLDEGIAILVQLLGVDRYTISWSLLANVYWSRDEDGIGWSKFLLEPAFECPYVYYASLLLRGRLHLVRDTAPEKECDVAI